MVGLVLLLAACGRPAPRNNLDYTHDDQFAIEDPGGRQATATGMGCGLSYKDAQTQAERTARYNLRGVMGPGRYRIRVDRVRQYRDQERYCAEVIAHAVF